MTYFFLYAAVFVAVLVLYMRRHRRIEHSHVQQLKESVEAGLVEPPSLHPVVDNLRCIGSGSCVTACPEEALGIIQGKAVLVFSAKPGGKRCEGGL